MGSRMKSLVKVAKLSPSVRPRASGQYRCGYPYPPSSFFRIATARKRSRCIVIPGAWLEARHNSIPFIRIGDRFVQAGRSDPLRWQPRSQFRRLVFYFRWCGPVRKSDRAGLDRVVRLRGMHRTGRGPDWLVRSTMACPGLDPRGSDLGCLHRAYCVQPSRLGGSFRGNCQNRSFSPTDPRRGAVLRRRSRGPRLHMQRPGSRFHKRNRLAYRLQFRRRGSQSRRAQSLLGRVEMLARRSSGHSFRTMAGRPSVHIRLANWRHRARCSTEMTLLDLGTVLCFHANRTHVKKVLSKRRPSLSAGRIIFPATD